MATTVVGVYLVLIMIVNDYENDDDSDFVCEVSRVYRKKIFFYTFWRSITFGISTAERQFANYQIFLQYHLLSCFCNEILLYFDS